jgi:hypothetical protein
LALFIVIVVSAIRATLTTPARRTGWYFIRRYGCERFPYFLKRLVNTLGMIASRVE